jgi:hypothetical protein
MPLPLPRINLWYPSALLFSKRAPFPLTYLCRTQLFLTHRMHTHPEMYFMYSPARGESAPIKSPLAIIYCRYKLWHQKNIRCSLPSSIVDALLSKWNNLSFASLCAAVTVGKHRAPNKFGNGWNIMVYYNGSFIKGADASPCVCIPTLISEFLLYPHSKTIRKWGLHLIINKRLHSLRLLPFASPWNCVCFEY